jgi:hypothetical protein
MRTPPADHWLIGRPLGLAVLVFATTACGGAKTAAMTDAALDVAASDGPAEAAPDVSDDDAVGDDGAVDVAVAADDGGPNCDPTGAKLAPTNDPACPPRSTNNPTAGSSCSVEALRCTYYGFGGTCLPGGPYVLTCCDGKWRFGIACPSADASAD